MTRQWLIPGGGFVDEKGSDEYLVPGVGFIDNNQPTNIVPDEIYSVSVVGEVVFMDVVSNDGPYSITAIDGTTILAGNTGNMFLVF